MSLNPFDRRVAPVGALVIISVLAACSDRAADNRAQADADLARDLALVQTTSTVQPIFRDTAITDAPAARPAPRPTPSVVRPATRAAPPQVRRSQQPDRPIRQRETRPRQVAEVPTPPDPVQPAPQPAADATSSGESRSGSIGAGAVLSASSNARVCTRSSRPGDPITATVNTPVYGTNGAEIPAGAKVVLELTSISGEPPDEGTVIFRVTSVAVGDESYPASGGATATGHLERAASPRNAASDRKKVIGGAIAGAILGQMMGKDTRSTVIGAAAGAAAGTAAAKMGDRGEACLPAGTALRITLDQAVVMR
jgi:Glycine zipper 2TM domain